jgi:hypothetical protein
MAITIVQQPPAYAFGSSPMVYGLDSTAYASTGFAYIADVFVWTGSIASVPASYTYRFKLRPDPVSARYGYLDIRNVVDQYLSATTIAHDDGTAQNNVASVVNVQVKFREYTNSGGLSGVLATSSSIRAYDGWSEVSDGLNVNLETQTGGILTSMPQSPSWVPIWEEQQMTLGVMLGSTPPPDRIQVNYSDGTYGTLLFSTLSVTGGNNSQNWMWFIPIGITNLNASAIDRKPEDVANLQWYTIDFQQGYAAAYETRVLADGGVCEGLACLQAALIELAGIQSTYKFEVQCEPRYTPLTIAFQNRYGAWDYLLVQKKSVESINIERDTYTANVITRSAGTASIPSYAASKQYFNTQGQEQLIVNTGFISEGMNEMVKDMMLSSTLQLVEQEQAVILKDTQVTYKTSVNDNLVQYTFTLEYANPVKNKLWL